MLVNPILACFTDGNPNVRYYATESLYNVVRVSRGTVLSQFNDIFTILVRLATDADQNVKNGSEMLDRIMKVLVALFSFHLSVAQYCRLRKVVCKQMASVVTIVIHYAPENL